MEINLHVFDKVSFTYSSILTLLGLCSQKPHLHWLPNQSEPNPHVSNAYHIPPARVGVRVGSIGFSLGPLGHWVRWVHVGSARLFG